MTDFKDQFVNMESLKIAHLIYEHRVTNEQGIGFLFWFLPFFVGQVWKSQVNAENHS